MTQEIDPILYTKLESLPRDELFDILTKAGVVFTNVAPGQVTKEDLLLVADEADTDILRTLL